MDSLPSELVAQIFQYLDGNDVNRFKQLNSRIKKIIYIYPNYISCTKLRWMVLGAPPPLSKNNNIRMLLRTSSTLLGTALQLEKHSDVISIPKDRFYKLFFSSKRNMSLYEVFHSLLNKGDIDFTMEYPFEQSALISLGKAMDDTYCKFTKITMEFGSNSSISEGIVKTLELIATKLKKTPPLCIRLHGTTVNYNWMKFVRRLGHKYSVINFSTNKICRTLNFVIGFLRCYPDESVDFICNITDDLPYPCRQLSDISCGFHSEFFSQQFMSKIVEQLPMDFVENHKPNNIPESIELFLRYCTLKVEKDGNKVHVIKVDR